MANPYQSPDAPSAAEFASGVRFVVLAFLCALSFLLYLDRVCVGQAMPAIADELGLSTTEAGWVLGAFVVAYGLFEVPAGHWGDRYGSRGVLTRIVLWWSAFTALTGAGTGLTSLVVIRFLFGAGEAGAYPNAARVLSRWFPLAARGTAQGFVVTAAQVGGAVAPMSTALLIEQAGWRWTFVLFGSLGLVWVGAFYFWFRDDPAEHPAVNEAERKLISAGATADRPAADSHPPIPWRRILASRNVWLMGGVQTCAAFTSYMFMNWYPTYLIEARGLTLDASGSAASLVLGAGAVGTISGGMINDWLVRRTGNRRRVYSGYGAAALFLAAVSLVASVHCDSTLASTSCAALTAAAALSQQASWWGIATQISGKHLGALFGLMNSMGVPGAFVSTVFLGWFADKMHTWGYTGRAQWDPAFYIYGVVLVVGGVGYLLIDSDRSAVEPAREAPPRP